jgi:anaphase-promoting complex subunit 8
MCPCFWAAWTELAVSLPDLEALAALELPNHWMVYFFRAHAALEAQQNVQAINLYEELLGVFPSSPYLQCQLAHAKYNLREFDEAQLCFEQLHKRDPYRLDQVDTYSNILYVKESKRALSSLAHACVSIDKYRPETCCVIGNYYSLKAEHEKAVLYFRRALKLNRHFLSAWTLMGHEYVELKNTAAAVDAYRHAVDINPKDYRAWYGLGQTYEILTMYFYALFYYRKATALRPYDARMWCAMAGCYKLLNRKPDAIKCYQRAESNHDREGIAYTELARLFRDEGDAAQAAHYFRQMLKLREQLDITGPETQEALHFLAHHYKDLGALEEAQQYCSRLLDFGGQQKEEAKALLRDIRSQFQQQPSN